MQKLIEEILTNTITVAQRDHFVQTLDLLSHNLYSSHQTIYDLTPISLAYPYADIMSRMFRERALLDNDRDSCQAIITAISDMLNKLEIVEIHVAYNIAAVDVKDIWNWFYYQLSQYVLLKIVVDESLIGGIVIYKRGAYRDYSISAYIQNYGRIQKVS